MADDRFNFHPELQRELTQLGPIMLQQEEAEAQEPDIQFVSTLRERLVREPKGAGQPAPVRPRSEPIPITRGSRRFHPPQFLGGILTAAVAAAVLALVINSQNATSPGTRNRPSAFALPTPNPTELGRIYPVRGLGGGGGPPAPWQTEAHIPQGSAYPAHLDLRAGPLSYGPVSLPAYELVGPSFDAARVQVIARVLSIRTPVKRSAQPDGTWEYAADYGTVNHMRTVHSVAINLRTGEMVYHDTRGFGGPGTSRPVNDPENVATARRFLTKAGWPGNAMPLHPALSPQEGFADNQVTLGWIGAPLTDIPEAVIITDSHGTIVDATALTPIARSTSIRLRGYLDAWRLVKIGKAPVAVDITAGSPGGLKGGRGVLTRRDVLAVLTTTPRGQSFLAPAYRFRGTVALQGIAPVENWVAVVPASR